MIRQTTRLDHEQRIEDAIHYILHHLEEPIDPRSLADHVCLSRFHFHRVFQALTGETVGEMVRRLRLEQAARRLSASRAPIRILAIESGYATHEAFIRAFRAAFGCTPSAMRRRRYEGSLPSPNGVHGHGPLRVRFVPIQGETEMQVEIRELPPRRAICMAHSGPYFMIGQTFDRLVRWMQEQNIPLGPAIALYYDDPDTTPAAELHSHAGVLVPDDFVRADPAVETLTIAGGLYAVGTHLGPYDGLPNSWSDLLTKWLPTSGYAFGDLPGYELYLNSCAEVAPEALRTEMCVPIRVPRPDASSTEGDTL